MQAQPFKITSRIRSTLANLEKRIKESVECGELRLPAVKSLAATMRVSTHTIGKAMALLEEQGVVASSPRRGTLISLKGLNSSFELQASRNARSALSSGRRFLSLKQRFLDDLLAGKLGRGGMLPTMKELSVRYGSCYSSVKKTLRALEEDRVLTPYKKGYRVAPAASGQSRTGLVVIAQTNSVQALANYTSRSSEFWRLTERECAARGLSIDVWTFDQARRNLAPARRDDLADVLGYMILTLYESVEERYRTVAALDRTLRPVVVLDEIGKSVIPSPVSTNPLMRLFVMSTTTSPGKAVGNYLLSLGHRRIAYFGVFINDSWSLNRYQGLKESFAAAGVHESVVSFGVDRFREWRDCVMAESGTEPFESVIPEFARIRNVMNPESKVDARAMYLGAISQMWEMRLEAILRPCFEKALSGTAATAWVAENDSVALLAMHYLQSRAIRVPEDISLVGFDNAIESLGAGLTSFDFDVPALVQATINHLLLTGPARRLSNRGPLEIHGMLMRRQSTGPAKSLT